jgi:hypothetical protein
VRRGGGAQAIDRLERDVDRGVRADAEGAEPRSLPVAVPVGLVMSLAVTWGSTHAAFTASNQSELTGDSVSEQMIETIQDRFHGQRVQAHIPYIGTYLGQGTITNSFVCPHRRNLIFEVEGLEYLPHIGDLSDCRKLYVDVPPDERPPGPKRYRIVYRLVRESCEPSHVEIIAVGVRADEEAYRRALVRLGRPPGRRIL